jgi:dipeptidyl aminopeptidase/acylaminoacyl peptidase
MSDPNSQGGERSGVTVRRHGTWPSTVTAEQVAAIPLFPFTDLHADGGAVRWIEARPQEEGRGVVVELRDRRPHDVTPPGFDVRTRVHEYGGGAAWFHAETVFFSDFGTSRLHRQDDAAAVPRPITPAPTGAHALRYADGCVTPDGRLVFCVRERHLADDVRNELVVLPADGSDAPRVVASGHDFFASPRLSPDGRTLAWLTWDHPRMPWDGTDLWVAGVGADGSLSSPRHVAGGRHESVLLPRWSPAGGLHFVSDRDGWWNLHTEERALTTLADGEIGVAPWTLGTNRYTFLDDGRIACVVTRAAVDSLELLDPESGRLQPAGLGWTAYEPSCLSCDGEQVLFAARAPTRPTTIVAWAADTGVERELHTLSTIDADDVAIPLPQPIAFPTADGDVAHAFYYPPANAAFAGPADEAPPLRVTCHGGPTDHASPGLQPRFLYWTSRGIGVLDVNYRGSSGHGRDYRRLLNGRWGEVDWRDCVEAARFLADRGEADPARTWVEGVSAGGYAVLCSLAFDPTAFAAGVSYFGVADVETLAADTHKFESHYFESIVGPHPERADLYHARSPLRFADRVERPLLLLQGLDDKIVPPQQAEAMAAALARSHVPHAQLRFAGEGHGFRAKENVRRSITATLAFVARIFDFEPADELEPLEIIDA